MAQADSHDTTTPGKAPAFQFYAKDFDTGTRALSAEEVGAYIRLLCYQWDKGSIPSSRVAQARIAGVSLARMARAWQALESHFTLAADDGQLINVRLERERIKQAAYRQKQSDKGKSSAANRKATEPQPSPNRGSTTVQPSPQPDTQPEGNSPISSLQSAFPDSSHKNVPVADARSRRPVFKGSRFVVFEWQLDDLRKMLGSHFDAFDIHQWLSDLDVKVDRANVVVPQRDSGKWLHEQTLAEAIRRGLPVVSTPQATGKTAGNAAAIARFIKRGESA